MDDQKHREFWIDEHTETFDTLEKCKPDSSAFIHVIEYSAIEELKAELKQRDDFIEVRGKHVIQLADERDQLTAALRDMVGALDAAKNKLEIYRPQTSGEYMGGMEYMSLIEWIKDIQKKHADLIKGIK